MSKKSLNKNDFIHADQEFIFQLIEANVSFPLIILWEKCMQFSRLFPDGSLPYPSNTDGGWSPNCGCPVGTVYLLHYNTPTIYFEEKLEKKFKELHEKILTDAFNDYDTRKKEEIEEIIDNDDIERLRTLPDFDVNLRITKENLLFYYSTIPILSYCIEKNAIKCFKYLLINGADPLQKSQVPYFSYDDVYAMMQVLKDDVEDIWDAYGFAGATGNSTIIKLLYDKIGKFSNDLIMGCTKFHKNNILSWVLKEDPSIASYGLINSIKYENIQAIKTLLDYSNNSNLDININITDRFQRTPLHEAARNNLLPIAKSLIEKGALIDAEDHLGNTPLLDTAKSDSKEIAQLLLDNGANK